MTRLITVDQAFTGTNFEIIQAELNKFHRLGVYDFQFPALALANLKSREAYNNWAGYATPLPAHTTRVTVQQ